MNNPKFDRNDPKVQEAYRIIASLHGSIITPKKSRASARNGRLFGGRNKKAKWPTGVTGTLRYHLRNIEKQGGAALTPAQVDALVQVQALRRKHKQ